MDFLKELNGSKAYTFHSHTEFCDGRATMEAFAREVVARGFTHYGFSPHCPLPIVSPCNMRREDVGRYLSEVDRIKGEYGGHCRFYAAMEVDYLGESFGPSSREISELPLDYVIGSVHFVANRKGRLVDVDGRFESFRRKMRDYFDDDIRYVCEAFYARSLAMVEAGGFDIIGHFDKIGQNASYFQPGIEDEEWYQALVSDLVDRIISHNAGHPERPLTVEINTKAYADHSGRLFPHPRHWGRLAEAGVPLIVNSDAHVPALIDASREMAFSMLEQAGWPGE
ncbi:MAG: histidinol-phosphatase [Muribaculaceae bacterium]|nr:histidinol-phosphatase [Muribaculaceae bacterium]